MKMRLTEILEKIYNKIIQTLCCRSANSINRILRYNSHGKKFLAFFINKRHGFPHLWMNELRKPLNNLGYTCIGLITLQAKKNFIELNDMDYRFLIDENEVKKLKNICGFIITDLDARIVYPQDSKVLAFTHACTNNQNSGSMFYAAYLTGLVDGFCIGYPIESEEKIKKFWEEFLPKHLIYRDQRYFYIIGCGHPKLSYMYLNLQKSKSTAHPDSICYAPVAVDHMPELGGNRIATYGAQLYCRRKRFSTFCIPHTCLSGIRLCCGFSFGFVGILSNFVHSEKLYFFSN